MSTAGSTEAESPAGRGRRKGAPTSDARGSSVIVTVIEVLRCFTVEHPLQGVTEIAVQVGLHKSSVSRILATLEKEQIVERDEPSRKFRLGLGLLSVAGPLLADLDVRRLALPALRDLTGHTGETSALVVWRDGEAVVVEQVASPHQIKHTTHIGTRYRDAESASVQIFLAGMPPAQVRDLLASGHPTLRSVSPGAIEEHLRLLSRTTEQGYAVNQGLSSPDEVGIAAAIHDHRGEQIAAVLLAAPKFRVPPGLVADLGNAVLAAATEVSLRLGGSAAGR